MKFIYNFIDVDLKYKDKKHLIINGNNGLVDLIGEEYSFLMCCINECNTEKLKQHKYALYEKLVLREYIVADDYDEIEVRSRLCERIRAKNEEKFRQKGRVHFLLTYACNFACPYCYEKDYRSNGVLSYEQVDKVFDMYDNDIPEIGFFGGEPLLPQNKEIIKYIISKAPHATYNITTNGFYLKEFIDILKQVNIVNLQVTLDGDKETHDKTRILINGEGTFDTIMDGIKLSLQSGFPITIRMNISTENVTKCLNVKKYIEEKEWADKNLWFDLQPIFQSEHEEASKLYQFLFDDDMHSSKKNMILRYLPPISNFLYNNVPLRPIIKACDADCFYRFFDPHGDMYSCIASVGDKRKRIGTYWPELKLEEKSFLTRDITTIPKCKSCKYALLCGGGCANAVNPDSDITVTPNCYTMYKDISVTIPYVYKLIKEKQNGEE